MNEREYLRLRRGLHEDYRKKLEALDLVWAMSNPSEPAPKVKKKRPGPVDAAGVASAGEKASLTEIVAQAVAEMPGEFSTREVDRWIAANHGANIAERSSISHALKRLPTVKLIEAGRGKRASTYKKLAADSPETDSHNNTENGAPSIESQHVQIRSIAKEKQLDVNKFRDEVLVAKYNVTKLAELSFDEAQEVIELLGAG